MGACVTLACVTLFCSLLSPIYGLKAAHHKDAMHVNAPHATVHHPEGDPHPPKVVPHPALHPSVVPHPALHSKVVAHPPLHPTVAKHPALQPKIAKHPALHLAGALHPLKNQAVHHLHPVHVNKTTEKTLPYKIPDLLDIAAEAFSYGDTQLKKYLQQGSLESTTVEILLKHVEAVRDTLKLTNFNSSIHGDFQRTLGLLLQQLVTDIKYLLERTNKHGLLHTELSGFGGFLHKPKVGEGEPSRAKGHSLNKTAHHPLPHKLKHPMKKTVSSKVPSKPLSRPTKVLTTKAAPKLRLHKVKLVQIVPAKVVITKAAPKTFPLTPEKYIPVKWEARHPSKVRGSHKLPLHAVSHA